MHKNTPSSPLRLLSTSTSGQDKMENFIYEYGRKVLYLIAGLFLLFIFMYRMSSGSSVSAVTDFMTVQNDFHRFQESSVADALAPNGPFTTLAKILQRHPELHQKYDGLIAQTWIVKSETSQAEPFAKNVFERLQLDSLPYYPDFSEATLLMSQHQYQEALKNAKNLKEQMLTSPFFKKADTSDSTGEILFALNLLRIAMLEQRVGSASEELNAWNEWQRFTQPNANTSGFVINETSRQLMQKYMEAGQASIDQYIKMRQRELKGSD